MNLKLPHLPEPDRSSVRSRTQPHWYLTQSELNRLRRAVMKLCPNAQTSNLGLLSNDFFLNDILIHIYFYPLHLPLPACGQGIQLVNARMRDKLVQIIPFHQAYHAACSARDMDLLALDAKSLREVAFMATLLTPLEMLIDAHPHYGYYDPGHNPDTVCSEEARHHHYLQTWKNNLLLRCFTQTIVLDRMEIDLLARLLGYSTARVLDGELLSRMQTAVSLSTLSLRALWNPATLAARRSAQDAKV